MLNSIGLANPGSERFLDETCRACATLGVPLWVSVGGFSRGGLRRDCAGSTTAGVDTIELNLSLSERGRGARVGRRDRRRLPRRDRASRSTRSSRPRPGTSPRSPRAVAAAGADGLSLVNTIRGLALDPQTLRPTLARATGGYSGPALKPIALACVYACAARSRRCRSSAWAASGPGCDALELVAAGASAVALGTVLFADPDAPARVRAELRRGGRRRGSRSPDDRARALDSSPR